MSPPSEAIRVLVQVALRLPAGDGEALARLVGHSLAVPSAPEVRWESIGLCALLVLKDGELPIPRVYDAEHAAAEARGEHWASRRALYRDYGEWERVQQVVVRFLGQGGAGRIPRSYAHGRDRPAPGTYSDPAVIARAIIRCRDFFERWPNEPEYYDWAALERRAARLAGKPLPWLPTKKPLRATFPEFDAALDFAMRFAAASL